MILRTLKKNKDPKIELAPLIDIVFVLLIFFAVSSSLISKNQGIPLDLPQASTVENKDPGITISITPDSTIYINKTKVLLSQIPNIIKQHMEEDPLIQVMLNADKTLSYSIIIDVLDHIRLSGCSNIALQTEKIIQK